MPKKCWRHLVGRSAPCQKRPLPPVEQKQFLDTSRGWLGPGRQGHLRATGSVCRDDEGQGVDTCHAQRSRRHRGGRRHLSGRNVQCRQRRLPNIAFTRKQPEPFLRPCCPNRAPTSKATCGPVPICWKRPDTPTVPKDFDDLIRILDSEIRLITPTDPEGEDEARNQPRLAKPGRDTTNSPTTISCRHCGTGSLASKRKRGVAEPNCCWRIGRPSGTARPENRQLPSLMQWCQIQLAHRQEELDAAAAEDDGPGRTGIMRCGAWPLFYCSR